MNGNVDRQDRGYPQLPEMSDLRKIEEELRAELSSALTRLSRARSGIESVSEAPQIPITAFRAAAMERMEALRNLEAASIRFATFVLDGIIPADLQPLARG